MPAIYKEPVFVKNIRADCEEVVNIPAKYCALYGI